MSQLEGQKGKAAQSMTSMVDTLRQAGRSMNDGSLPVAQYVTKAADQLESLTRALNDKPVEDLLVDAETFARSQPALFLGLAFAAGLAAARFLKSSSRSTSMADRVRETVASATGGAMPSTDGTAPGMDTAMPSTDSAGPRRYSEPVAGQSGGW